MKNSGKFAAESSLFTMHITFIQTGKTTDRFVIEGVEHYRSRIRRYVPLEIITLPGIRGAAKMSPAEVKSREGRQLIDSVDKDSWLIILDENGQQFSTKEFARFFRHTTDNISRNICFASGGAWGFSDEVCSRANYKLSLSKLTFPHQLVRLIFAEQFYRILTFLEGEPYHHE